MGKGVKSRERRDLVIAMYRSGLSLKQVAEKLGCTKQNVHSILKYWNVPRKPMGNLKLPRRNCKVCGNLCKSLKTIYCSPKCSGIGQRRCPQLITHTCAGCGIVFQRTRRIDQICKLRGSITTYHSHECFCKHKNHNAQTSKT